MFRKITITMLGLTIISACSSAPERTEYITVNTSPTEPIADKVLSRIDDLSERPKYIKESEPFYVENGNVYSLGMTTLEENQRIEAGYRIASNNAKHTMSQAIEQKLSFIFQRSEENEGFDSTLSRYIGAESTELVAQHIKPTKLYWEKVATTSSDGQRKVFYKVFSLVSMPESEFKKSVLAASNKAEKKGKLSEDFSEKVNAHWDDFTARKPATEGQ